MSQIKKLFSKLRFKPSSDELNQEDPPKMITIYDLTKKELQQIQATSEVVQKALIISPDTRLVSVASNRNDQDVYLMRRWQPKDGMMKIILHGEDVHHGSYLYSTILKNKDSTFRLHIHEFHMLPTGQGNGSIVMSYLIEYAKRHQIHSITGILSSRDKHKDRGFTPSIRFYKRHGFQITFNEEMTTGHFSLQVLV